MAITETHTEWHIVWTAAGRFEVVAVVFDTDALFETHSRFADAIIACADYQAGAATVASS